MSLSQLPGLKHEVNLSLFYGCVCSIVRELFLFMLRKLIFKLIASCASVCAPTQKKECVVKLQEVKIDRIIVRAHSLLYTTWVLMSFFSVCVSAVAPEQR